MKHTPGPWHYTKREDDSIGVFDNSYGTAEGIRVAEIEMSNDRPSEANAKLISAAPDLLEACQALMKAISGMQWYDEVGDAIKLVEAAIAKVE